MPYGYVQQVLQTHPTPPVSHPQHDLKYHLRTDAEKQIYPAQYCGYPGLSQWMASSHDFFLLRRFSSLSARSLLYLQNEITQREKKLEGWDLFSMKFPPGQGGCGSFQQDENSQSPRVALLKESIPLLQEYYNLINAFAPIKNQPTANDHQQRNLKNWFSNRKKVIDDEEQHFLEEHRLGDLFPIVSKPKTPLARLLGKVSFLRRIFNLSHRADRAQSPTTQYHSGTGFDIVTSIVIVIVGLAFLFAPMWWLNYVTTDRYRLGIITCSVSIFAAWLWMAAGPRAFEILAGSAAYAAVLMVFLQVQKDTSTGVP